MFFNRIKTLFLLLALSGIMIFLGKLLGGTAGLQVAFILSIIMNVITYFFAESWVLRMYGAQRLDQQQYGWIYAITEELCQTMKLPMPRLWLIQTSMPNAFATGRSHSHSSIAVTTGILDLLDHNELRGVLAHELSHIKNYDMLVTTTAATFATTINYIANMLLHGSYRNNRRNASSIIGNIVVALSIPIAASILQLAISRSREYLADETGAQCCKDPLALASALQKIQMGVPKANFNYDDKRYAGTASLFIIHPLCGSTLKDLFSTHPPTHKRIARLQKMYEELF